jgi:hypothetical protein
MAIAAPRCCVLEVRLLMTPGTWDFEMFSIEWEICILVIEVNHSIDSIVAINTISSEIDLVLLHKFFLIRYVTPLASFCEEAEFWSCGVTVITTHRKCIVADLVPAQIK